MELLSAQRSEEGVVGTQELRCRKEEGKGSGGVSRRRWTSLEDAKLREQVAIHGSILKWTRISEELPGRSRNSCRFRWVKLSKADEKTFGERGSENGQSACSVYGSNYNMSSRRSSFDVILGRPIAIVQNKMSSPPPLIDFLGVNSE